jgi:hypothetical protein
MAGSLVFAPQLMLANPTTNHIQRNFTNTPVI